MEEDAGGQATVDAGAPDAGDAVDAATEPDAGEQVDAGGEADAGEAIDAGEPPDAGEEADAGEEPDAGGSPTALAPRVKVLWPPPAEFGPGPAIVGGSRLPVRVAAVGIEPGDGATFAFDGFHVSGVASANLTAIYTTLDEQPRVRHAVPACARPVLSIPVDLSSLLGAGAVASEHALAVTVVAGGVETVEAVPFWHDPRVPGTGASELEAKFAPDAFRCLEVVQAATAAGAPLAVELAIDAGPGVDLAANGFSVSVGGATQWIGASQLACASGTCTFDTGSAPVRSGVLARGPGSRWTLSLAGPALAAAVDALHLYSLGGWGGVSLVRGERLLRSAAVADSDHSESAVLNAAGGSVEAVDANGVRVRLDVPPGAVESDTRFRLTPLLSTGSAAGLASPNVGVRLEPAGYRFAGPVEVTFDFSAATPLFSSNLVLSWLSSPVTRMPLRPVTGAAFTLRGKLSHFSEVAPGPSNAQVEAVTQAANAVVAASLAATAPLSLEDVVALASAVQTLQQLGADGGLDMGAITNRVEAALQATLASWCPQAKARPSKPWTQRLLWLEASAQQWGIHLPGIQQCLAELAQDVCSTCDPATHVCVRNPDRCCAALRCSDGEGGPGCGSHDDGCGGVIHCGPCQSECEPESCAEYKARWGNPSRRACAFTFTTCGREQVCATECGANEGCDSNNFCMACIDDCRWRQCGLWVNNCGNQYSCGLPDGACGNGGECIGDEGDPTRTAEMAHSTCTCDPNDYCCNHCVECYGLDRCF